MFIRIGVKEMGEKKEKKSRFHMALGKGIQSAVEVLAFVFIIGGVFQIMARTNALNMGIQKIVKKLGTKEILIIPILMALFGLGGSIFGMSDELVPFYLLIMPVMFAMGYDSMTTFMTVCLSATVGYAASTINPFCVLVAQGIAGIQGNPQLVFRMIQWVIMMAVIITFVTWRAMKIKKNPEKSIVYQDDLLKKKEMAADVDFNQDMTLRQKLVLVIFLVGMVIVVVGSVNEYFCPMVFYAMSVAYRTGLQDKRRHPLDMRRYMGVVKY